MPRRAPYVLQRGQGCFRGSTEEAARSTKGARGSAKGARGSTEGAPREHEGAPREHEGALLVGTYISVSKQYVPP